MVSVVAQFQSTPLSEIKKMPSREILDWYNEAVLLHNKLNKVD